MASCSKYPLSYTEEESPNLITILPKAPAEMFVSFARLVEGIDFIDYRVNLEGTALLNRLRKRIYKRFPGVLKYILGSSNAPRQE